VVANRTFDAGSWQITPVGGIRIAFEGDADSLIDASFIGSGTGADTFEIEGVETDTMFIPSAGVVMMYNDRFELFLNGAWGIGSDVNSWQANAGLRWTL
jgi:hypothetical protein